MSIDPEHIKERLNYSYVTAVAAKAGATVSQQTPDYGIDATIQYVQQLPNGKYQPTGFVLHCQLKATTTSTLDETEVVYDMDVNAYNKLANWQGTTPCILILLCLPKNENDWLSLTEQELLMRNCCYWKRITGPPSENDSKQRVRIARGQLFTPTTVEELLRKIRSSEEI
jgi:hypothetical protein